MMEYKPSPEFEEKVRQAVSAPSANPGFVNQLRNELVRKPAKIKSRFNLKLAWVVVIAIVVLALIVSAPSVAKALKQLLGYLPGVGLVENTGNLRMLAEPSSVTRDGITVTVTQVMVYEDHVELTYKVDGIAESYDTGSDMCGSNHPNNDFWSDGDAELRLPDGTVIRRDYAGKYQSENRYAMKPVYAVSVPSSVTEMTMLLKCIPFTKLGAAPENWEVPFKLVAIPAGTVVGEPVVEVNATSEPVATEPAASKTVPSSPQVTFTLERVTQTDAGPIFYIHMHVANPDPALVVAIPRDVYVIDARGQKIQYMGNTPSTENLPTTVYEYIPTAKPAHGALTLVVANTVIKYAPQNDATFTFNAGENPQYNQTWALNKDFDIADYKVNVESVRAVIFDDIKDNPEIWNPNGGPDYPEGSQGFDNGYQFKVNIDSMHGMLGVQLDVQSDACGMSEVRPLSPSPVIYYTNLCRNGYPKGDVNVILRGISVLVKNVGQVVWSPDDTAVNEANVPATATSNMPAPIVTMTLEKIVPLESRTVFYVSMDMENRDPSLISIMPVNVYVIDSLGQKIRLIPNFSWQAFQHRVGSAFEFTSQTKPALGPLTLTVENAVAVYAPLYTDPPRATPDQMSFTFEAGNDPQYGQIWELDNEFEIAGYKLKVTSARAVDFADIQVPGVDYSLGSQGYDYGYDFALQADPSVKMQVEMDIISESPICWLSNIVSVVPESSSVHYTKLCRDKYPEGNVKVTIGELSVLMENAWQAVWKP